MALVLIFAGLIAGGAAAVLALCLGAGFLVAFGVYLVCGALGTGLAAGLLWRRAARHEAAPAPPADWGLPAP